MNITLGDLIRDIVEVYVDDIVVKTRQAPSLLENLARVFDKLRATRMKLNPEKCVFGVSAGKLLGFLVSHRGIEANPDKIRAIEVMRPPARLKDVQKLTGSLAALSHFISRLAERALPFFKIMWGSGPIAWSEEAEQAFQELKRHLASLPILVALEPEEPLFLYLSATVEVVSMVLVAKRSRCPTQGPPGLLRLKKRIRTLLSEVRPDPRWRWVQKPRGPGSPHHATAGLTQLRGPRPSRS
jgi:hypothetical protein